LIHGALLSFVTDKSNENIAALKTAKANVETTKQELKDYKDKAARILQVMQAGISYSA